MKPAIIFLSISLAVYACGGVIGNIEKYPFGAIGEDSLKVVLDRVYAKHPGLSKTDTSMYGMNDGDNFYFVLDEGGERFVFKCNVVTNSSASVDLSLTSATKWGEVMDLAPNMESEDKKKYSELFEQHILPKIKE